MIPQTSHIRTRTQTNQYLLYDHDTGETKILDEEPKDLKDQFCRKIHKKRTSKYELSYNKGMFSDPIFILNQGELKKNLDVNNPIIYRRLIHLYPKKHRPSFFTPKTKKRAKNQENETLIYDSPNESEIPTFLRQINLFPESHYRSMFITQDYSQQGRYELIVNSEGRFEVQIVDDYIPVYEQSDLPIWGMDIKKPWLLILAKVWAKKNKGYQRLMNAVSFKFISTFTNSNWRYSNLHRQTDFLQRFQKQNLDYATILLKTISSRSVSKSGLFPGQIGYKFKDIIERDGRKGQYIIVIESVLKNSWTGNLSIFDENFSAIQKKVGGKYSLEKDIFIEDHDFFLLFGSAYVTSNRQHAFSNYYLFQFEKRAKNAMFLQFEMPEDGFLDFAIKQAKSNRRKPNQRSQLNIMKKKQVVDNVKVKKDKLQRYQKVKFALIEHKRDVKLQNKISSIEKMKRNKSKESKKKGSFLETSNEKSLIKEPSKIGDTSQIKVSNIGHASNLGKTNRGVNIGLSAIRRNYILNRSQIKTQFDPFEFELVEIDYDQGFSNGESQFLDLLKGFYILRIKTESADIKTRFILNYTSNHKVIFNQAFYAQDKKRSILEQCFMGLANSLKFARINRQLANEKITFANQFDKIGYGFIFIMVQKRCTYSLLFEVNPTQLHESGYYLKSVYKDIKETFGIVIKPQQRMILILKKINDDENPDWPPRGIRIFQRDLFERDSSRKISSPKKSRGKSWKKIVRK